ncbi:MAG: class I SAM-dependent methyltransferase [Gammaproteobacteria bacterium]|nr:class I SAM-dependent methyltransferase [Gammaproteobacteria bacterium]
MFERIREVLRRSREAGQAYPPQLALLLRNPLRRMILSPAELLRRLDVRPDDRVLELGPGPGYFSVDVARALPRGALLLVDLQPDMLAKAQARLTRAGQHNVSYHVADARALPLAEGCIDVAFLVAVLGEVPDQAAALSELFRVIRPGGRLNLTEQPGDPDFIPRDVITAMAEAAGFRAARHWGKGRNFSAEFLRP